MENDGEPSKTERIEEKPNANILDDNYNRIEDVCSAKQLYELRRLVRN